MSNTSRNNLAPTATIVGRGRVGAALARALPAAGVEVRKIVTRTGGAVDDGRPELTSTDAPGEITTDLVLIAVPDDFIAGVAHGLLPHVSKRDAAMFHFSGALASGVMRPRDANVVSFGSIHPLVSVPAEAGEGAAALGSAWWCVEGEPAAVAAGRDLVGRLGGTAFEIAPGRKALYHAAAVTACGHYVALFSTALDMLERCGLDRSTARQALVPLARSTVEALARKSPAEALTGPFARADSETFRRHLEAFAGEVEADDAAVYLRLAERSLELAAERGADPVRVARLRDEILFAKEKSRC